MTADLYEELERAIREYNVGLAAASAKNIVEQKMDLIKALDVMTKAVRAIGDGFGRGEMWLPDLVGAAEAMSSAVPILRGELERAGGQTENLGTVVIGTVFGDLHTIGKTMVSTFLIAEGFTVHDVGINVNPEEFVEAVKKYRPQILAMSALMTMTAPEQEKTIALLKKEGLRDSIKIMVGGGAITQEFADGIGADGYDATAPGAGKMARRLLGR